MREARNMHMIFVVVVIIVEYFVAVVFLVAGAYNATPPSQGKQRKLKINAANDETPNKIRAEPKKIQLTHSVEYCIMCLSCAPVYSNAVESVV